MHIPHSIPPACSQAAASPAHTGADPHASPCHHLSRPLDTRQACCPIQDGTTSCWTGAGQLLQNSTVQVPDNSLKAVSLYKSWAVSTAVSVLLTICALWLRIATLVVALAGVALLGTPGVVAATIATIALCLCLALLASPSAPALSLLTLLPLLLAIAGLLGVRLLASRALPVPALSSCTTLSGLLSSGLSTYTTHGSSHTTSA
mmetsp:Transcript_19406/g.33537  ORF Transcript_19406/g.33537 Transcript_19406/m.33537 type:complete len:204 (-) Transcript_19406:2223-2834(-)